MDNALDQIADKCSKYLQVYRTPITIINCLQRRKLRIQEPAGLWAKVSK